MTWLRREVLSRPYAADTILAVCVYAMTLLAPGAPPQPGAQWHGGMRPLTGYDIALAAVVCGALVFRQRWPRAVLAVTVTGFAAYAVIDGGRSLLTLGPAIAVYTVASRCPRRHAWAYGGLAALVVVVARGVFDGGAWLTPDVLAPIAFIGMATAVGDSLRSRRAYVAAVEERARRAEETREEEAERRVMEERLHIARELHDVLAHHIALINVQAQVAAYVLATQPEQARAALSHVREAGKEALEELRTTVGLLRRPGSRDEFLTEPAPGLDRLPELVDSFTAAGLKLDWQIDGDPRPLPAPVDLAAFRIAQEALTNVSKHAPRAAATVRIGYAADEVIVDVADDGRSGAGGISSGIGHGLIGMRERALSVDGTFFAGPVDSGGFRVHAVLPISRKGGR
ncbi:Signal transduction histidine kinase [Nonomuraea solani]|uniref:histidine kinase n=1 Tax=Nonomuraea solani TaxID=1144553 RepID=A0A1H6CRX9_9ACTN|nr:histidine kinase [Nonomuraea solani]SEG75395.1 Signal transduction histidine kinase [Nonomuraea solani]